LGFSRLTDRERLIAEQAVETLRTLDRVADETPRGQGLARMEAAIHDKGFDLLRARLKLNNARWRIRRAERIGMLRCVDASNQWENFWKVCA
jgi:hypothetical protein